jgi:hypothetical protein
MLGGSRTKMPEEQEGRRAPWSPIRGGPNMVTPSLDSSPSGSIYVFHQRGFAPVGFRGGRERAKPGPDRSVPADLPAQKGGIVTIGEAALFLTGVVGLAVNLATLREALGVHRWVQRAGGMRSARLARSHIWRASLRIVAALGALVVGGLAAATPGRFVGAGMGLGVAVVAGVSAFGAIVTASILDLRGRPDAWRGIVRELMAEHASSIRASG